MDSGLRQEVAWIPNQDGKSNETRVGSVQRHHSRYGHYFFRGWAANAVGAISAIASSSNTCCLEHSLFRTHASRAIVLTVNSAVFISNVYLQFFFNGKNNINLKDSETGLLYPVKVTPEELVRMQNGKLDKLCFGGLC